MSRRSGMVDHPLLQCTDLRCRTTHLSTLILPRTDRCRSPWFPWVFLRVCTQWYQEHRHFLKCTGLVFGMHLLQTELKSSHTYNCQSHPALARRSCNQSNQARRQSQVDKRLDSHKMSHCSQHLKCSRKHKNLWSQLQSPSSSN